ncbi:MAG: hypothetical protein SGBAC_008135 [Bacillariaceae sp.]
MTTAYDMSMLILAETIIDTISPSSEKGKLQLDPAATTELPTIPILEDDLEPIPLNSMADREVDEAFVSFAASLNYHFLEENDENLPMDLYSDALTITTRNKKSHSKSFGKQSKLSPKTKQKTRAKRRAFSKIKDPSGPTLECRKHDVLLGRGGHASTNPGNLYLLRAVRLFRAEYTSLGKTDEENSQKRVIVQHLVSLMEDRGSRFLYRVKSGEAWREASSKAVNEKISHMLRD